MVFARRPGHRQGRARRGAGALALRQVRGELTDARPTIVSSRSRPACSASWATKRAAAARIEEAVISVFEGWDYEEIIPPLFDYADVFADPGPGRARPTRSWAATAACSPCAPTSRACSPRSPPAGWPTVAPPIRLYYSGEVLRYEPPKAGPPERALPDGARAPRAATAGPRDAEVLAIAARVPGAPRASRGYVLALGHVGVFARPGRALRPRAADALDAAARRGWRARTPRASSDVLAGAAGVRPRGGRARAPHRPGRRARASLDEAARALRVLRRRRAAAVAELRRSSDAPSPRPASAIAWPSTSARCAASTTTRASSSASTRAASASRWAAAAATTRCSRASAGPCRRSASCSASTALALLLERQGVPRRRARARPRKRSTVARPRRRLAQRAGAPGARAARVRLRGRKRDEPHRRPLQGQAARRARRRSSGARACLSRRSTGRRLVVERWTACASCS